MVWLSPLGWIEESRPLTDPHPMALLPVVVLVIAVTAVTLHLAGTRDLGAATLPDRDTSEPHLALLGSPPGLAVRLMRPVALGWLFAVAAFAVLIGTVAESATKDSPAPRRSSRPSDRLGGHGSLVADYLGLTFLILALMIALVAAGQITAIRAEEADGRLENLARPAGEPDIVVRRAAGALRRARRCRRACWRGSGPGLAPPASTAGSASDRWWPLVSTSFRPSLFLLGLGALVFGAWPRRTSTVVYGYLAWSFLIEFVGAVVHASHWLFDTSVFFHMVPAPAASPDWPGGGHRRPRPL